MPTWVPVPKKLRKWGALQEVWHYNKNLSAGISKARNCVSFCQIDLWCSADGPSARVQPRRDQRQQRHLLRPQRLRGQEHQGQRPGQRVGQEIPQVSREGRVQSHLHLGHRNVLAEDIFQFGLQTDFWGENDHLSNTKVFWLISSLSFYETVLNLYISWKSYDKILSKSKN